MRSSAARPTARLFCVLGLATSLGCASTSEKPNSSTTPEPEPQAEADDDAEVAVEHAADGEVSADGPQGAVRSYTVEEFYKKWTESNDMAFDLSMNCQEPCLIVLTGTIANEPPFDTTLPARYEPERDRLNFGPNALFEISFADDDAEVALGGLDRGESITLVCPPPDGMNSDSIVIQGCVRKSTE